MAPPLLEVRNLKVEFPTRGAPLVALDDVSFEIAPGEILGVVGESGAGKSLTGSAIIGLLDPPGRISGGEIRFDGRRIDNLPYDQMRRVRGRQIGAIFQDPLTSLDPLYTVGAQLVETIRTHLPVGHAEARVAPSRCSRTPAFRPRRSASTSTRTSSRAACASASSSPLPWRASLVCSSPTSPPRRSMSRFRRRSFRC
jgi:ABC-type glutathione transport system ATPase component